ncbi:WXG100 family type VII secretion target [Mycobacterium sp.]|uniref:WXG100 family type VII secretion target n=1 Tax=Mycobacterium sp. TaxID=1785 RepID=UPI0031D50404
MAQLTTDTAVLVHEAANFERIAGELKTVIAKVEQTAGDLDGHWQGTAAQAAQRAIRRFQQAADAQIRELNAISTDVHTAGARYAATDGEQAGGLASAMDMNGTTRSASGAGPATAPPPQNGQVHPATANADYGHRSLLGTWKHGNGAPAAQSVDFE